MSLVYLKPCTIEEIHIEISTLCNAACPMCMRSYSGYGNRPTPGLDSWQIDDEFRVFNDELVNLKRVYFCGTHGDPLTAPRLLEVVRHIKKKNICVEIFTNGSLRSLAWWNELLEILDKDDLIVFGIDGIKTNHLYRQNTNIEMILERLSLCCKASVKTQWDYLVFKHNEHELDFCQEYSLKIGVDSFRIKKTARFKEDKYVARNSTTGEFSHYLEPPENIAYRHHSFEELKKINKKLPDDYNISCLYREAKKIYVNSRLEVFPCCYISDENESMRMKMWNETINIPVEEFNLRKKTWNEILSHEFYINQLVKSFKNKTALKRCIKTCGVVEREKGQSEYVFKS